MTDRRRRGRVAVAAMGVLLATATAALAAGGAFAEPDVEVLHTFEAAAPSGSFGWAVSTIAEPGFSFAVTQRQNALLGEPFNGPNFDQGSAYVYSTRTGALLRRFDGAAGDWLGFSVADAGDVDGDEIERHPRRSSCRQRRLAGLRRPVLRPHRSVAAPLPRRAGRRQLRLGGLERRETSTATAGRT